MNDRRERLLEILGNHDGHVTKKRQLADAILALFADDIRDAECYRLLRKHPRNFDTDCWADVLPLKTHSIKTPEKLDAAVHVALNAAKGAG